MNEEIKGLVNEIVEKTSEKVLSQIADRKDVFGGEVKSNNDAKTKAAEYIKAVYNGDFAQVKALSEGTTTDGGYLVPEYFASEIVRLAPQYGVVRRMARIWPMQEKTVNIPTLSSVTAYRVAEKASITASQPTVGRVTLSAKKLAVMVPMSNELLRDANIQVVDTLSALSAEALALKEDDWGFNGLGAGEGIFQNANVPDFTLASGTDFTDVTADDLLDALNLLDESALPNARWYMSFSVFNIIRKLKDDYGRYIVQEPAGGMPATIWNLPVEFVRVLPSASDTDADTPFIAVGDLRYMIMGDMRQYEIAVSKEATITDTDGSTSVNLFEQDMSAVRVIERVDIQLAEADKAFVMIKTHA